MPDPKKSPRDAIVALLELAAKDDPTADEAEAELRAAGVDVDGFLTRLRTRLADEANAERLSWLASARRDLASHRARRPARDYKDLDRPGLIALVQERQAHVAFHKLQEQTDDDLRTMLMDLDELADDNEDPT
jgi:hypothetical protein